MWTLVELSAPQDIPFSCVIEWVFEMNRISVGFGSGYLKPSLWPHSTALVLFVYPDWPTGVRYLCRSRAWDYKNLLFSATEYEVRSTCAHAPMLHKKDVYDSWAVCVLRTCCFKCQIHQDSQNVLVRGWRRIMHSVRNIVFISPFISFPNTPYNTDVRYSLSPSAVLPVVFFSTLEIKWT